MHPNLADSDKNISFVSEEAQVGEAARCRGSMELLQLNPQAQMSVVLSLFTMRGLGRGREGRREGLRQSGVTSPYLSIVR